MHRLKHKVLYFLIRFGTYPFSFLSYRTLHRLGIFLGDLAYYCIPEFRKNATSNLALAKTLGLKPKDIRRIAKESFHNLMTTTLEYPKLAREKAISELATCENPELAAKFIKEGKGVIFFCGHQANWEILFLEGTSRMPGVAIGRPVTNPYLYRWVIGIRQRFQGKIIEPKNAVKEGLRALKKGAFLGIVGDQGKPDSNFTTEFLGRKAFSSPLPALLSYRTGAPIFVATLHRKQGRYRIRYSEPLFPDRKQDAESEIPRLMQATLSLFEKSVSEHPGQWLWQHNRWKLQSTEHLKRVYGHNAICVAMPQDRQLFKKLWPHISTLKEIYPEAHFTLLLPSSEKDRKIPFDAHVRYYRKIEDLFVEDYAPKLLFNFTGERSLRKHYGSLSVFKTLTLENFPDDNLSKAFQKELFRAR